MFHGTVEDQTVYLDSNFACVTRNNLEVISLVNQNSANASINDSYHHTYQPVYVLVLQVSIKTNPLHSKRVGTHHNSCHRQGGQFLKKLKVIFCDHF